MLRYTLPSTYERVRLNTKEKTNSRINNTTNENINYYKNMRDDVISLGLKTKEKKMVCTFWSDFCFFATTCIARLVPPTTYI